MPVWIYRFRPSPQHRLERFRLQGAIARSGDHGVERDNADRVLIDGILDRRQAFGNAGVVREGRLEIAAPVVIAGHEIDWHVERGQQLAQFGIFGDEPVVGQIAGDDDAIGPGREPQYRAHGIGRDFCGRSGANGRDG